MRSAWSLCSTPVNPVIVSGWVAVLWVAAGTLAEEPISEKSIPVEAVGPLVIIGGAESSDGRVLKRFVQMAGGVEARLAIIPAASQRQQTAIDHYEKAFSALGVRDIHSLILNSKEDASNEAGVRAVMQATGIFFSGGDQSRIVNLLQDTPLARAILDRNKQGIVLAGTSAGAATMSRRMIRSGASNSVLRPGIADIGPGMTLIRGVLIDQHFSERGRQGRFLSALADRPQSLGVGIDENTALIVEDAQFRVVGAGAIYVYDVGAAKKLLHKTELGETLALAGVALHVIPGGFRFHFESRTPVITGEVEPYPPAR